MIIAAFRNGLFPGTASTAPYSEAKCGGWCYLGSHDLTAAAWGEWLPTSTWFTPSLKVTAFSRFRSARVSLCNDRCPIVLSASSSHLVWRMYNRSLTMSPASKGRLLPIARLTCRGYSIDTMIRHTLYRRCSDIRLDFSGYHIMTASLVRVNHAC